MFGGTTQLTNMPVFDREGAYIGKAEEVFIDPHTWELKGISVGDILIAKRAIKSITYKITLNACIDEESHTPQRFAFEQERQQRIHDLRIH